MRLSDLQKKNVIDIKSGKMIGVIIDVNISMNGNMTSLVVDSGKFFSRFSSHGEIEIGWSQINKIGEDVILVSIDNLQFLIYFYCKYLIFMDLSSFDLASSKRDLVFARDFALKIAKENNKRVSVGYFCEDFDGLFSVTPDGVDYEYIFKSNDIGIPLFVEKLSLIHNSLGVVSSDEIMKAYGF